MTAESSVPARSRWIGFLLESLAIVASILLAFAIDAGWEERQERRAEQGILEALVVEFEGYRDHFEDRSEFYRDSAERMAWLLDDAEFTPSEMDLLDQAMLAFVGAPTFDRGAGVHAELVASGRVSLIADPDLRRLVSTWEGLLAETTDNEEVVRGFIASVMVPFLARRGAPVGRASSALYTDEWTLSVQSESEALAGYRLVVGDREFRALASWRYEWALGSADDFARAAAVADSAVALAGAGLQF